MSFIGKNIFCMAIALLGLSLMSRQALAYHGSSGGSSSHSSYSGGGGDGAISLEFGLGTLGTSQDDINKMINYAIANNAASTRNLGSAWEFFAQYQYRFSGTMFAVIFRPSYVMQSATGSGTGGSYNYNITGYTLFPMVRIYPLENDFLKFFMQTGVGYGNLNASITEGANSLSFGNGNFGAMGGIGVDFCFTPAHCLTIEGNIRYLSMDRNVASSAAGSFPSLSQATTGKEVEINGTDISTSLSGVQGFIAYTLNF